MARRNRFERLERKLINLHRSIVARLSRELTGNLNRQTIWVKIRDYLNLAIQIGILFVLGFTCQSNRELARATREYTEKTGALLDVTKAESIETRQLREATQKYAVETEKLRKATDSYAEESRLIRRATEENTALYRKQFRLSTKPQMYGYLCSREVYFEWYKKKYILQKGKDRTPDEYLADYHGGVSCYLSTENNTNNLARNVSAYIIKKNVPGVFPSLILEPGVKPNSNFIFVMLKNPEGPEGIKNRLIKFYGEKATNIIFDPIYLPEEREFEYFFIVYEDLLGNICMNRTLFQYEPNTGQYVNLSFQIFEFRP